MSSDKLNQLPYSWVWTQLGEVCHLSSGGTPSRMRKDYWNGSIPWVKIGDIPENGLIERTEESITEAGLANSSAKIFPKRTILFTIFATIGKVGILEIDAATNQAICGIKTLDGIDTLFMFHYLRYAGKNLAMKTHGITQANINMSIAKRMPIPLPPTQEQRRIVAKVESLLAESKTAREALDKIPVLLRRFRQSILAKAFKGELTHCDPHDEPGQKLLERIREERQKGKQSRILEKTEEETPTGLPELPQTWIWTTIGELETFIGSGITPRGGKKVYVDEGIPFIRSQNVHPDGLHLENVAHITPQMHKEMKRTQIHPNDVLLNITGASIGRSTYIPEGFGQANVNQHVCIVRTGWWMVPAYLSHFLNSIYGQDQIFATESGVTREGLNYTQVRGLKIPLAPLSEQICVVAKIEEAFSLANQVEVAVKKARKQADKIDQTILAKAFRGELVPQDPNDEPAAVLLQRVKAAKQHPKPKTFQQKIL